MPDIRPFAGLDQEDTQQAVLNALRAILEALPRVSGDGKKRMVIDGSEIAAAVASISTVTTVSTVSSITALLNLGVIAGLQSANAVPLHMAQIGSAHIYNQIIVS